MDESTIRCQQCGNCCRVNVNAFVTDEDLARWRREGRGDILHVLENEHAIWVGDHLLSADNGADLCDCPFLQPEGGRILCSIYGSRPRTCREYVPGSSEICSQFPGYAV